MAKLAVKPPHSKVLSHGNIAVLRYGFDTDRLWRWFGGPERLVHLCAVYGLPADVVGRKGNGLLSTNALAVLLELAERMHKPLDLYQFVVQVR